MPALLVLPSADGREKRRSTEETTSLNVEWGITDRLWLRVFAGRSDQRGPRGAVAGRRRLLCGACRRPRRGVVRSSSRRPCPPSGGAPELGGRAVVLPVRPHPGSGRAEPPGETWSWSGPTIPEGCWRCPVGRYRSGAASPSRPPVCGRRSVPSTSRTPGVWRVRSTAASPSTWVCVRRRRGPGPLELAFDDRTEPRLGFVWDVGGRGKWKVYGGGAWSHVDAFPVVWRSGGDRRRGRS